MAFGSEGAGEDDEDRYAVVDEGSGPILYVRVVGEPTKSGFLRYQDDLVAAMRRQPGHFAVLALQGRLQFFPLELLREATRWIRATEQEFGSRWVGAAFVLTSPLIRRVMSAMLWAAKNTVEMTAFGTHEDALAWCTAKLAEANRQNGIAAP